LPFLASPEVVRLSARPEKAAQWTLYIIGCEAEVGNQLDPLPEALNGSRPRTRPALPTYFHRPSAGMSRIGTLNGLHGSPRMQFARSRRVLTCFFVAENSVKTRSVPQRTCSATPSGVALCERLCRGDVGRYRHPDRQHDLCPGSGALRRSQYSL
jgi:hypothetical protein